MYVTRRPRTRSLVEDFTDFLVNDFSAESLDDKGDVERRPDFRKGSLLIELKSLEASPKAKIEKLLEPARRSYDWPLVFGKLNHKHLRSSKIFREEEERIRAKIQRSTRDHLKKANKQIGEYGTRHLGSFSGILVILNEENFEFTPEVIMHAMHIELKSGRSAGRTPYHYIDSIIYISEAHFTYIESPPFAAYCISKCLTHDTDSVSKASDEIIDGWCRRMSAPELSTYRGDGSFESDRLYIIPEVIPQHELWRHDYRKSCYLSLEDHKSLTTRFCQLIMLSVLYGTTTAPNPPNQTRLQEIMRPFTELLEEFSRRGTDMKSVVPTADIQREALKRLKVDFVERQWLAETFLFHANGSIHAMNSKLAKSRN